MERRKHITKNIRHNRVAMLYWTLNDIFQSSAKQYDLANLEEHWNGDTKYFLAYLLELLCSTYDNVCILTGGHYDHYMEESLK